MADNDRQSETGKGTEAHSGSNPSSQSGDSNKDGSGDSQTRAKGRSSSKSSSQSSGAPSKAANDQAQSEQDNRFTSQDVLTDIKAAQGPLQPTAIDAQGIERIVGPAVDDNWRPAPVDPDPDAIAHHELVLQKEAERREERLGATQAKPEHTREGAEVTRKALEAERGSQKGN